MLKFSLVICTYQRPNEIRRLLEAIAKQTTIPDEIIVVDGSLDDQTETVIKENSGLLGDRLFYLHVQEAERGLTRQRNVGIRHAKGEIIAFLDDDTVPNINYFVEILACFQRHPEAIGVGGLITNETNWSPANLEKPPSLGIFRWKQWERREDFRWRLRKLLKLDSPLPPGWMPPFGHGRSGNYPPDDNDYQVEAIIGAAFAWRNKVFNVYQFSTYFEGYGLYEDLDFCIAALQEGSIYLCTRAQLEHHHASGGRPNQFRYGMMVVRNGWFVWRRRWRNPSTKDRIKWWTITFLLMLIRFFDFRDGGITEALGRIWGMTTVFLHSPKENTMDKRIII